MKEYKTIGILGGMGPEATADMYMKIVRVFQKEFGAKYDGDFPPIFIYSIPIPEVVEEQEDKGLLISMLIKGVKSLEFAGADFIAIACNTVQCYLNEMRESVRIPILSIAEETARVIRENGYKNAGVLATSMTIRKRLFDEECRRLGLNTIYPDIEQQEAITGIIINIMSGFCSTNDREKLKEIIKKIKSMGAESVILGCTELPLLIKKEDSDIELLDTTMIMAEAAVRESRKLNISKTI